jgi:6-phosphofructokinase 2
MFDAVTLTLNPAIDLYTAVTRVEAEHKLRCDPPDIHAGGGGVNVARVLARFGHRAVAVYAAGGRTGEWVEDLLAQQGIDQDRVAVAVPARENVTVLERSSGQQYRFVMPGMDITDAEWRACLDRVVAHAAPGAAGKSASAGTSGAPDVPGAPAVPEASGYVPIVVASGSLPTGVPADFYALLAAALSGPTPRSTEPAHGSGLNPHAGTCPRLVLDTAGEPLRLALEQGVYLVAPNRRELDDLAGRTLDGAGRRRFAETLLSDGRAEIVVVKLDADGALVVSTDGAVEVAAPAVSVLSAVGAGDSFLGALIAALGSGWELDAATRLAVASGSAACTKPGTELADLDSARRLWGQMSEHPMPPLRTTGAIAS